MIFDKNYDYCNIFNNIRSSSSYHGYLIDRFQSGSTQNAIRNTGHVAELAEANGSRVFSFHFIPKTLLGKTKREYFGRKVNLLHLCFVLC